MRKLLKKTKTITITYSNLLMGNGKTTEFSFSLSNVKNKVIFNKHLKEKDKDICVSLLLSHSLKLQIPNNVFKLNLSAKEIILEKWWYDKIKRTYFIDEFTSKNLKVDPILFERVVKLYLSKNA